MVYWEIYAYCPRDPLTSLPAIGGEAYKSQDFWSYWFTPPPRLHIDRCNSLRTRVLKSQMIYISRWITILRPRRNIHGVIASLWANNSTWHIPSVDDLAQSRPFGAYLSSVLNMDWIIIRLTCWSVYAWFSWHTHSLCRTFDGYQPKGCIFGHRGNRFY